MEWWPCFLCGCESECPHREPELRAFVRGAEPLSEVVTMPQRVETAPIAQESREWAILKAGRTA